MEESHNDSANGIQAEPTGVPDKCHANLGEPENQVLRGCLEATNQPDSTFVSNPVSSALPYHVCAKDIAAHSLNPSALDNPTDKDTESCLPIHLRHLRQDDEDDCDPQLWDGVVPIEVKAGTDDEDLICEFCSPRLEAGDQPCKRTEDPFASDDDMETEGRPSHTIFYCIYLQNIV